MESASESLVAVTHCMSLASSAVSRHGDCRARFAISPSLTSRSLRVFRRLPCFMGVGWTKCNAIARSLRKGPLGAVGGGGGSRRPVPGAGGRFFFRRRFLAAFSPATLVSIAVSQVKVKHVFGLHFVAQIATRWEAAIHQVDATMPSRDSFRLVHPLEVVEPLLEPCLAEVNLGKVLCRFCCVGRECRHRSETCLA